MPENDGIAVEMEDTERVSPDKRGRPAVRHSESGERLPEDGFIHARHRALRGAARMPEES